MREAAATVPERLVDAPSHDAVDLEHGSGRTVARESLHDLFFNPGEGRNYIDDEDYARVLADLRERLETWMVSTGDPLLNGLSGRGSTPNRSAQPTSRRSSIQEIGAPAAQ